MDLLEKRNLSFSHWVNDQMTQEVKKNQQIADKPQKVFVCGHGRNRTTKPNCSYLVCPVIDKSLGQLGQEREFARMQPICVLKKKPSGVLASTQK